ncbi:MAG TPA: ImcF-related family protein [Candidatus Sulfopaludibacter sp.]|jgi:type VI secretion system protein ImpL|nr:ImcF-related family protein [Candidatus Sulfopaludibacter sp.]
MKTLYIVIAVAVLLLIVLLVVFLVQRSKKKKKAAAEGEDANAPGGDEISLLIKDAETKLSTAKLEQGARVANLPVYVLMGDTGSTKTSVMLHSGLDPELIAGQVYQNNNVVSTRTANLWFARRSIFVEAGGKLPADSSKWQKLIKRLTPKSSVVGKGEQAPRAAVVCYDCESFTRQGALEAATAAARTLRARLGEISQTLGINLPVYVLFTKMDRLPFFTEYVRNLNNDEATQVLGATLPMLKMRSEGVYGDEESARLGGHFEWLFRSLANARPEFLVRETDPTKLPACYEFPREFRKVRQAAVQFMVDLCRPSQLTVGPFLRGFYFTGVRPVVVNETAPVAAAASDSGSGYGAASGATGIFSAGGRAAQPQYAAPPVTGSRKVPQWVFLSHFFNDVLLADRAALGASGSSTKTSFARRLLLVGASVICLILLAGFTTSFFQNRGLESKVREAAQGIPASESVGGDLASVESLRKLETLRQALQTLVQYRHEGAPWSYRWLLYVGNDLYPEARRVYFDRFKQLLFGNTQNSMLASLRDLPATPGPEYGPTYDTLKGYLITTAFHDKSTSPFLSPVLMRWWSNGRPVDPERQQLAQKQFDFYAGELKEENPYSKDSDAAAVEKARRYLSQFGGVERVYTAMLAEAGKNPPINFNRQFPGSAQVVVESHEVRGAFSKAGWNVMKDALQHPDRFFKGEQWVLGDQGSTSITPAQLDQLRSRYSSDFVKEWRAYIKGASVVRYAGLKDASDKLMQISGNQSPLLELMALASQNTAVDDPAVAQIFQPVQAIVPPTSTDRFIAPTNQNYMNALVALQTSLEAIASQPGSPNDAAAAPTLANAQQAIVNTRQMAQTFRIDSEGHIESSAQKLLEDPITFAQGLLRSLGPAELNGKGRDLCNQMRPMLAKYPFSPNAAAQASVADITAVFKPQGGLLWQFVDANMQKALTRTGSQYVPNTAAGITVNPAFLAFLNRAAAFSDAAFQGGAPTPHFSYMVRPILSSDIDTIHLSIDGQPGDFKAPNSVAKKYEWPGPASGQGVQMTLKFKSGSAIAYPNYDGVWGIFQFVANGKHQGGSLVEEPLVDSRGRAALNAANGQPITVTFDISANPAIFDRGYFTGMGCVAEVAKP